MGVLTKQDYAEEVIRIEVNLSKELLEPEDGETKEEEVVTETSNLQQDSSGLWWIHGDGYDLDDFVSRHPGGIEAIMLGKGRDCTALVESYHPFSSHHWYVIDCKISTCRYFDIKRYPSF